MAPAGLNKGASVPSPTWRTSWLGSAMELEARLSWLGRHGGGGDQELDFACSRSATAMAVRPPASSEDLGALYGGVWRAGGVFDGIDDGGFRMLAILALVLRALVGGAEVCYVDGDDWMRRCSVREARGLSPADVPQRHGPRRLRRGAREVHKAAWLRGSFPRSGLSGESSSSPSPAMADAGDVCW